VRLTQVLALALSCVALTATAQNTNTVRALSLRDCIDLSLRHNLGLKIDRYTAEIARYGVTASYGGYDPSFHFDAAHQYDNMPQYFRPDKANPDFGYTADSEIFGTGFKGKVPTGLTYDLAAHVVNFHNVKTFFQPPDPFELPNYGTPGGTPGAFGNASFGAPVIRYANEYYMDAGLALTQPLLKDFWIDKERRDTQLQKNQLKVAEIGLRGSTMRVVTDVQLAYIELLYARENIRVEQRALELANQLLRETKLKVNQGQLTQLQEQQAQVHVETVTSDLISAQQLYAQQQNVIKQLIGDDFNAWWGIEVNPTDRLIAIAERPDRVETIRNALTKRPDILQMQLALERQKIVVKYNYNQLFPSLDLKGSIGIRSANRDIDRALEGLADVSNPYYGFGALLTIPLGNTGARANYKASQLAREQALLQLKLLENQVMAEVQSAMSIVDGSYRKVATTRRAREVREAALVSAQKELGAGSATTLGVLQALNDLTTAELNELRALADYNRARAQLAFGEGLTLDKNLINVQVR
jgi:outer membrane protein